MHNKHLYKPTGTTMTKRHAYFISDGTGISAETFGQSLLSQFDGIEFEKITIPYIKDSEIAKMACQRINEVFSQSGEKPLVFATLVNPEVRREFNNCDALILDFFSSFIQPLEEELGRKSSHSMGKTHGLQDYAAYKARIDAVNYALTNDDGANIHNYEQADIILIGVSRCGKTPTCLYLALQFAISAANYPFTEDDIANLNLPDFLQNHRDKLFGLTIDPYRLHIIRSERRQNSQYASLEQCEREVRAAERLFKQANIPYISSTTRSIEEISTTIIASKGVSRYPGL